MWMHNGLLELTGEKMSKSLGNIVSLQDALEKWGRKTILLFFMTAQWRKPIDFSDELMAQAAAQAETFRNYFVGLEYEPEELARDELARILDDDFNTPEALALFHDWRGSRTNRVVEVGAGAVRARVARGKRSRRLLTSSPLQSRGRKPEPAAISTRQTVFVSRSRRGAGKSATLRTASSSFRNDARADLRPPPGARGAARPARGPRALGHRTSAQGRAVACARHVPVPGTRSSLNGTLTEAAGRATTRACSRGPSPTATRTHTSSPRRSRRCSSVSTRSPTRTTSARSPARRRRRGRPAWSSRRITRLV